MLVVFVSCSGKPSIKYLTDLEQENLKGHVAKLVTETYAIDSTGQNEKLESITIEIFNEFGYTVTDTIKDITGNSEQANFFKYNKNGSLSSVQTFENGKTQSEMLWEYNGDKCTGTKIYDGAGKLESYYNNISQNKYGLLTGVDSYDTSGKLIMSYTNEYDSIYQVSARAKDSIGILRSEVIIHLTDKKYQANTLETTYEKGSASKKYLSYKYEIGDAAGNWTQQVVFDDKSKAMQKVKRIFSYR